MDQIIFLMGNLTFNKQIRTLVRENFNLSTLMSTAISKYQKYCKNMTWVANNLSEDPEGEYEIADLYTILTYCMTNDPDIVGGLYKLSKNASDETIELISGINENPKKG